MQKTINAILISLAGTTVLVPSAAFAATTPTPPPPMTADVMQAFTQLAQSPVGVPPPPPSIGATPLPSPSSPAAVAQTTKILRTLVRGMRGADVMAVQQKLIVFSYLTSDSATGYFGSLTQAAVSKFQCDKGLVCSGTAASTGYGTVGKKTRGLLGF
jgi:Putative peptidoglycan binding domain